MFCRTWFSHPSKKTLLKFKKEWGLAFERGHKETAQILQKHLAVVMGTAGKSLTLHQAAVQGLVTEVLDHLGAGESPNLCDPEGNTPLMLAVKSGSIATIRILSQ